VAELFILSLIFPQALSYFRNHREMELHLNAAYQGVSNLVVCFPITRSPSVLMNAVMWKHGTLDNYIFRCGKVHYSNHIIITNFMYIPIPNCWFDNIKLSLRLHWNLLTKLIMWYFGKWSNTHSSSSSFVSPILSSVNAWKFRTITHQWSLSATCYPVTYKVNSLNCWYDSLIYEKSCP
jgi:hypothetical protein